MNWLTDSTAFAYTYTLYGNLMCSLLYLTYDAVQKGVLRYLALSLVSKPAETTMAPQLGLFVEKCP